MSDDSNPMHKFGHGRGDHNPKHTAAYSFVDPQRVIQVGDSKVEPTQPMEAVDKPLTVRDVINRFIEADVQAWKALPPSVRDALLDRPQDFQLIGSFPNRAGGLGFSILYNGVVMKQDNAGTWVVDKIVR